MFLILCDTCVNEISTIFLKKLKIYENRSISKSMSNFLSHYKLTALHCLTVAELKHVYSKPSSHGCFGG